jgi:hypothetical protein
LGAIPVKGGAAGMTKPVIIGIYRSTIGASHDNCSESAFSQELDQGVPVMRIQQQIGLCQKMF